MSVAAATTTETKGPSSKPMSLWAASLIGGVYVLMALAVVFYCVPYLWQTGVSDWLERSTNGFTNASLRIVAQIAVAVLLAIFGAGLAGPHPQTGLRGGIFLAILTIFAAFFLARGFLGVAERMSAKFEVGQAFTLIFFGLCLYLFWKFIKSDRLPRWAVGLEAGGWFSATAYKRTQGVRVRRFTILGVLLLLGSGIYSMLHNHVVTTKDWAVSLPYTNGANLTLLPDVNLTLPLILAGLAIWFAWRVVNYPVFADFLIATEAEINKVSWTPRARLIQDTIVVLITVFIITLFLFVVDIFWGWFLSRELINVLPSDAETRGNQSKQVNTNEY
jgi:preprotein translocase SecE subunit